MLSESPVHSHILAAAAQFHRGANSPARKAFRVIYALPMGSCLTSENANIHASLRKLDEDTRVEVVYVNLIKPGKTNIENGEKSPGRSLSAEEAGATFAEQQKFLLKNHLAVFDALTPVLVDSSGRFLGKFRREDGVKVYDQVMKAVQYATQPKAQVRR